MAIVPETIPCRSAAPAARAAVIAWRFRNRFSAWLGAGGHPLRQLRPEQVFHDRRHIQQSLLAVAQESGTAHGWFVLAGLVLYNGPRLIPDV
jgi:hypothetical protein